MDITKERNHKYGKLEKVFGERNENALALNIYAKHNFYRARTRVCLPLAL